jgi:hypothetical protein
MITLALLVLTGAPAPKHFERLKDFDTKNTQGHYAWFDDRYALIDDLSSEGEIKGVAQTIRCSVLDAKDGNLHTLSFAFADWAQTHTALFYSGIASEVHPRAPDRFLVHVSPSEIVHADGDGFWFIVRNDDGKIGDEGHSRYFLVRSSDGSTVLMRIDGYQKVITSYGGLVYLEGREEGQVSLIQLDPKTMTTKVLATMKSTATSGHWYPNADRTRFAYAEYSEKSQGVIHPPAKLHVLLPSEHFEVLAPVSPYGGAWTLDNTTFYIGSNELQTIQRLDIATKELTQVASKQGRIQGFFLTPNGKTMLVITRQASVSRFSLTPFKALRPLPVSTFLPGKKRYSWDWTVFSPNRSQVLFAKTETEGTLDYLDMEAPGVSWFKMLDD